MGDSLNRAFYKDLLRLCHDLSQSGTRSRVHDLLARFKLIFSIITKNTNGL